MGLRTPQQMTIANIRKQESTRFQGAVAPQIDKTFLKTAANVVEQNRVAQLEMVKTRADNEAEMDVITANAELANETGLNTLDKSISLREKLARQFQKRKEKIPEQFHPYVDSIYAKKLNRFNKFAIPHTLSEVKKVHTEEEKTFTMNAMNEAVEDSGDPEEFSTYGLAKVQVAAARAARRQYGEAPELIKAAVEKTTSSVVVRAISQQAFIGRFDNAEGLFERHNAELSPDDRIKAIKAIDQAKDDLGDREATTNADAAFARFAEDPAGAIQFIQSASSSEKAYKAGVAFYNMKVNAAKESRDSFVRKNQAEIYKQAALGRDVQGLIYNLEPGEERNKMVDWYNKTNGGKTIITDYKAVRELTERLSNAYSANQLPDDLLESFRGRIAPQQMKPLEQMFLGLKNKDNESARRVHEQGFKIVKQSVDSWAKANNVYDEERGRIELAAMDEFNRIVTFNPKISSEEIDVRIRNILRERGKTSQTKPRTFFGSWTDVPIPFTSKTVEGVNDDLSGGAPSIHPYWLNEMQKLDPNLTEFQKNAVISDLQRKGIDISKPMSK